MSFLDRIEACNRWDRTKFRPFIVGGVQVGWLTRERVAALKKHRDVFVAAQGGIALHRKLSTPKARTKALKDIAPALAATKLFPSLRKELYAVKNRWSEKEHFRLDRGLVPAFGVRAYGVHVNGFVRKRDGLYLWIGTRTTDRPVEPGKLDNMVAGGQPAGLSLAKNVAKECEEEAFIGAKRAATARPVSVITYCCERDRGLRADTLFCFDLEMPRGEKPKASEEIAAFHLMPATEVLHLVRSTKRFKFNVGPVIVDFAIRHGLITPENEPDLETIVQGLHVYPQPIV
jgi:hypothetical protein